MSTNTVKFDDAAMCTIVAESLGLLGRLGQGLRAVRVKNVKIDDTVILVDFYAESRDMISVKVEIVAVMGALSGLLKDNELSERPVLHYGVRGWENDSTWLVYAVCSAETAKMAGSGRSLDWLRGTQFQVNTSDWRLARAKALTSRVEIGLRDYIDSVATAAFGTSWWNLVMDANLKDVRKKTERQARRSGMTGSSSRELLDFTYLTDLPKIIQAHWAELGNAWSDPANFATEMTRLNKLRRSEAHNRAIEEQQLADLEAIHDRILDSIAHICPEVVPQYLADKWRLQLLPVVEKLRDAWGLGEPRRDLEENVKRLESFQKVAASMVGELGAMQVPHGRSILHQKLTDAVRLSADSAAQMLEAARRQNVTEVERAFGRFESAMRQISQFEEAILLSSS